MLINKRDNGLSNSVKKEFLKMNPTTATATVASSQVAVAVPVNQSLERQSSNKTTDYTSLVGATGLAQSYNVGGFLAQHAVGLKIFMTAPKTTSVFWTYVAANSSSAAAAAVIPPGAVVAANVAAGFVMFAGVKFVIVPTAKLTGRGVGALAHKMKTVLLPVKETPLTETPADRASRLRSRRAAGRFAAVAV
jgi:hypothetical protein